MQYFDIECRVPDKRPLFNKTIPLLQCMNLCLSMPSCLSVFVSKGETCKGYYFTHRYLTGLLFGILKKKHISAKVMLYRYMYTYNTWLQGRAYPKCKYVGRERTYVLVLPSKKSDICYIVFLKKSRSVYKHIDFINKSTF